MEIVKSTHKLRRYEQLQPIQDWTGAFKIRVVNLITDWMLIIIIPNL